MTAGSNRREILSLVVALIAALTGGLAVPAGGEARAATGLPVPAPPGTFETGDGTRSVAEFRGQRVMLWMLSTWCSSCAVALTAMQEKQAALERAGLVVIALRNFDNGGYPGPSLREFVERYGRPLLDAPNWSFGEVPAEMASAYNPRRYPDIYFLIDEQGVVQAIEGAPAAMMATIARFVGLD